jgi:hypothetical protein
VKLTRDPWPARISKFDCKGANVEMAGIKVEMIMVDTTFLTECSLDPWETPKTLSETLWILHSPLLLEEPTLLALN